MRKRLIWLLSLCVISVLAVQCTGAGGGEQPTVDQLIGMWEVTSVVVPAGGTQTPAAAGLQETASFQADGSFTCGMLMGGAGTTWGGTAATATAVGKWSVAGGGSYSTTGYPSTGNTVSTNPVTLSGGALTTTIAGPGGNYTFTLTKVSAPSSSDALIGLWEVTSVVVPAGGTETPAAAGLQETASFQADGSFTCGMQMGGVGTTWQTNGGSAGTATAAGKWSAAGGGSYNTTGYPSTGNTVSTNPMTLSGGTLTTTIAGPGGNYTFTLTKVSAPSSSDPVIGLWEVTSVDVPGVGTRTPTQAGFLEVASFAPDGSLTGGMLMGGGGTNWGGSVMTMTAAGKWSAAGGGSYNTTGYPSSGNTAAISSLTVSGTTMAASVTPPAGPPDWTLTFTKR